jgi:integrase
MPRKKLDLTKMPMPAGVPERWRKVFKGTTYYFRGDYTDCLNQWFAKRAALAEADKLTDLEIVEIQAARLHNQSAKLAAVKDKSEASAIVAGWRGNGSVRNINQAVEQFLSRREVKVANGEQSAAYYSDLKRSLNNFADFVGRSQGVDRINGEIWDSYCAELRKRQAGGWSAKYCHTYQSAAKTFVRWAWRLELLKTLPRNLDDRDLSIKKTNKEIKVFSIEEIKTLLTNSPRRTRLFLLLALNCGFTQKDISDLKQSEIDWKGKRINRKRSKTKDAEGVPTVEYPLWQATYDLLAEFKSEDPNLALLNEDGRPLLVMGIIKGKFTRMDCVRRAFSRLVERLAKKEILTTTKTFKILRKTSPTILQKSPAFSFVARHFLGHAPRGISDKHYVKPDQATLDAAIAWLGEQYEVATLAS